MKLIHKIILFLLFLPLTAIAEEDILLKHEQKFHAKFAVVDLESVLEHSTAIHNIKKSISSISEQIQKEFSDKEIALKKSESDLINQQATLSEEEFKQQLDAFHKKVSETQKEMHNKKNTLEQAYAAANSEMHKNIIDVIRELSKKHGFSIVFPSTHVMFVENDMNITLEVINDLNSKIENIEIKYIPQE